MYSIRKFLILCAGILTALAVAGFIAAAFSGWATSALAEAVRPGATASRSIGEKNVVVIPAAAFNSDGDLPDKSYFSFAGGFMYGDYEFPCLMAPVYLPPNVTISQVWATVYDNESHPNRYFWMNLYRVQNDTGEVTELATLETSGASTMLQQIHATSIQAGQVSFPEYSYYLGACLPSQHVRLYSVRVWYDTFEIYLPLIIR